MSEDAARVLRAEDDYEYLRARANAELHAVPSRPRRVEARPVDDLSPRSARRLRVASEADLLFDSEREHDERAAVEPPAPTPAPASRYEMRRPTRPRAVESPERSRPVSGIEGRRTIEITGQAAPSPRRHITPSETFAARPDRIALWGFLLGLFLILMAVSTAHAAV